MNIDEQIKTAAALLVNTQVLNKMIPDNNRLDDIEKGLELLEHLTDLKLKEDLANDPEIPKLLEKLK